MKRSLAAGAGPFVEEPFGPLMVTQFGLSFAD